MWHKPPGRLVPPPVPEEPTEAEEARAPSLVAVVDQLVGMYFWWDSAPPSKKAFYHGRIAASLDGGYYLLAYSPSDKLPAGLHEIAHVALMADQAWSFYLTEVELYREIGSGDGPA